jgi:hypothetical protein
MGGTVARRRNVVTLSCFGQLAIGRARIQMGKKEAMMPRKESVSGGRRGRVGSNALPFSRVWLSASLRKGSLSCLHPHGGVETIVDVRKPRRFRNIQFVAIFLLQRISSCGVSPQISSGLDALGFSTA